MQLGQFPLPSVLHVSTQPPDGGIDLVLKPSLLHLFPLTAIAPYRLTDYVFGLRRLGSQIAAIYASDQYLDCEAFVGLRLSAVDRRL